MTFGKIANTPEEAIDIVTHLTNNESILNKMTSNMRESKIEYATQNYAKTY